uniref:ATP-binding protein n=1 Tax=Candidatus Methanogaster sp. ANME-2c ERB4 TaxID=2759911 RepID=A0A7G9YNJ1_9EURY|nr:hypothetical protein IDCAPMJN_00011 [Methanosarcinales archaeon ANME-2c ERB4]
MRGIEFHNREKETIEIRAILDRRPTLITFVYGPINSGKTELITHTIEELPDEYVVFYINLRTKSLSSYDDFIESLFEMEIAADGALKKGVGKETLAIEEVYSEAMLEDRCRYLLVDGFDEETTMAFLEANVLSEGEKELVRHHCGGKPICLVELANVGERGQKVKGMLTLEAGEIRPRIKVLKIANKKILFEGEEVELKYENIIKILDGFSDGGSYAYEMITPEIVYPVKENILFVDPVRGIIKPQSWLNLLAIREVVKDV